jgi:tripartite ATP-independent transporter DctM subunit
VTGGVSIGKLFVAGIVPGIIMMFILMFTAGRIANKRDYPVESDRPPTFLEVCKGLKNGIFALLFPVILIVGIRFGLFTASEAGAFAVVYALVIGVFVYRELTLKAFFEVMLTTVKDNGVIMFIIMAAGIFGYGITYDRVPQSMAEFIVGVSENRWIVFAIIMVFVFIAGMFMEATVNTLLLTPIFLPIVTSFGFDPIHFGIVFMTTVTMGGMTPPVGVTMYTTCSLLKCPVEEYMKESLPFIGAVIFEIILLAVFPQTFMWLPNLVFGG